ncbi:MAG: hypothetical protein MUE54_08165, partial [Anaerolineae bacterium]|nr:hypothetical protein [Anaerolineae bacterium]
MTTSLTNQLDNATQTAQSGLFPRLIRFIISPSPLVVTRVVMALNFVVSILFIAISRQIFATSDFFNLGEGGRWFLTIITFFPFVMAVTAFILLRQKILLGRYISLVMLYVTFVLSIVGLLHVMGIFLNFSAMVDSIMQNITLAWFLPVAYALFWVGGRLEEKNRWRGILEQLGIGLGIFVIIFMLFSANFLASASSLIDMYTTASVRETVWLLTVAAIIYGFFFWRML